MAELGTTIALSADRVLMSMARRGAVAYQNADLLPNDNVEVIMVRDVNYRLLASLMLSVGALTAEAVTMTRRHPPRCRRRRRSPRHRRHRHRRRSHRWRSRQWTSAARRPRGHRYWGDNSNATGGKGARSTASRAPLDETFHVHTHLAVVLNGNCCRFRDRPGAATATRGLLLSAPQPRAGGRMHIEVRRHSPTRWATGSRSGASRSPRQRGWHHRDAGRLLHHRQRRSHRGPGPCPIELNRSG